MKSRTTQWRVQRDWTSFTRSSSSRGAPLFQTTSGLLRLLDNQANRDDLLAFFAERMLPLDEIAAGILADEVLRTPPQLGYLTISNALQWRLQYSRAIEQAGVVHGLLRLK